MTTPSLRFDIFNGFRATHQGSSLNLTGAQPTRVLAALITRNGRVASIDVLVDTVWDDAPPPTAAHQIRKTIAKLRAKLPAGKSLIVTEGSAYRLDTSKYSSDYQEFLTALATSDTQLTNLDYDAAATTLKPAIDAWGPLLGGTLSETLHNTDTKIRQQYLTAADHYLTCKLALAEGTDVVSLATSLTHQEPLAENFRGHLMGALYQAGRSADALSSYESFRAQLAEELGIDPGPALKELHQQILNNDPALLPRTTAHSDPAPVAPQVRNAPPTPVPPSAPEPAGATITVGVSTLPRMAKNFCGRHAQLDQINAALENDAELITITGMGGQGKTTLALQAAKIHAGAFPDGQLFVDLQTFRDNAAAPPTTAQVLDQFFLALGIPGNKIPGTTPAKVNLWRDLTRRHKLLVILDDARTADQIEPLLAAGDGCLTIATSRYQLSDADPDLEVLLAELAPEESTQLLTSLAPQAAADPLTAAKMATHMQHYPLALRLLGNKLRRQPSMTAHTLYEELQATPRALEHLADGSRSVQAVLQLSLEALDEQLTESLIKLATFPVPNGMTLQASAVWLNTTPDEVLPVMHELSQASLIAETRPGTYQFHELVRSQLALRHLDNDFVAAAQGRLDCYLYTTMDMVFNWDRVRISTDPTVALMPPFEHCPPFTEPLSSGPEHDYWVNQHSAIIEHFIEQHETKEPLLALSVLRIYTTYIFAEGLINRSHEYILLQVELAKKINNVWLQYTATYNLAFSYDAILDTDTAAQIIQEALALHDQLPPAAHMHGYLTYAQILESQGKPEESVKVLETQLAKDVDYGNENLFRARASLMNHYLVCDRVADATALIDGLLDVASPEQVIGVHYQASRCYFMDGKWQQVLDTAEIINSYPVQALAGTARLCAEMSYSHMMLGDNESAARYCLEAEANLPYIRPSFRQHIVDLIESIRSTIPEAF